MLHHLSKCFATAYLPSEELIKNGFMPFKVDGYQIGWINPQSWVALAQFKHIFSLKDGSVNITINTDDITKRDHFVQKVLNILAQKEWIASLDGKTFDIISPLNQKLCSVDIAGAVFFGLELPVVSLTTFFQHEGKYFYWLMQEDNKKFAVLYQHVLHSKIDIPRILNQACINLGIGKGVANATGHTSTRRLIKSGLLSCKIQNYTIEMPSNINLSFYDRRCKLLSADHLINLLETPNSFTIEDSIILADILQQHNMLSINPKGIKANI